MSVPDENYDAESQELNNLQMTMEQDTEDEPDLAKIQFGMRGVDSVMGAEDAEAWAIGKRAGVPVGSTDPTWENNAKHYARQADGSAEDAEAWAVGKRGGQDVGSDDPAYQNSAKYYRDRAAAIVAGDVIDDNAGRGDTKLTWSADKLAGITSGDETDRGYHLGLYLDTYGDVCQG